MSDDEIKRMPWRPTKYEGQETIDKAIDYMTGGWQELGHIIPSVVGLCTVLCVSKSTIYDWAKQEDKADFSDILECLNNIQEQQLMNGGLSGSMNATICKLVLGKHGYHDRMEVDNNVNDKREPLEFGDPEEAARAYKKELG